MKSFVGIRISNVDVSSNGPAVLRRVLLEYAKMLDEGKAGCKIPDKVAIGDITIEMSAGPMSMMPGNASVG